MSNTSGVFGYHCYIGYVQDQFHPPTRSIFIFIRENTSLYQASHSAFDIIHFVISKRCSFGSVIVANKT